MDSHGPGAQDLDERTARLLLIVPKDQAKKFPALAKELADMPECQVIIDRRVAERRKGGGERRGNERRRAERRSGRLERPDIRVLFVY